MVIDHPWGEPAAAAMAALITHRADDSRPLTWIQIGSVGSGTFAVDALPTPLADAEQAWAGAGRRDLSVRRIVLPP